MYLITEDGFSLNLVGADCIYFKSKNEVGSDGHMRKCVAIFASNFSGDWLIKKVKSEAEAKEYISNILKFKGDAVLSNDLSHFE